MFCLSITLAKAQNRNINWAFGDSSGINFNTSPPSMFVSSANGRGSSCSISDSSGQLLFYTHTLYIPVWLQGIPRTCVVYNKLNQVMDQGDHLMGTGWYNELVIIPNPDNNQQYYLFQTGVSVGTNPELYYSIIDLSFNNGLGKVIQKNTLLDSVQCTDGLIAIKHGNGRDWWLLFKDWSVPNNSYLKCLITPSGISSVINQHIGTPSENGFLNMTFNKDGTKMCTVTRQGLLELFDFDRCTGNLSNPSTIDTESFVLPGIYTNAAFSANGNVLYVASNDSISRLYQYDLTATNITATKDTIAELNYPLFTGGFLRLAPNNKIYWSCIWYDGFTTPFPYPDTTYNIYNTNLSFINYPDSLGTACDFQPFSFYLGGTRTYWGLPNNPDYDLGALLNNPCPVGLEELQNKKNEIKIYPNPANYNCSVLAQRFFDSTLILYDILGNVIMKQRFNSKTQLNLQSLSKGVYIIELTEKNGNRLKTKLIVE